ncbi:hypothetical protein HZB88_01525 [archaeon]|nr:hypothetical protein [archaeon]
MANSESEEGDSENSNAAKSGGNNSEKGVERGGKGGTKRGIGFSFGGRYRPKGDWRLESTGEKKIPWLTIGLIIILLPVLYIAGMYGMAYAETPQAQRAMTYVVETIPGQMVDFWRDIANPEGRIGTIWETDVNLTKKGILFKDFELLLFDTKSVPAGNEWNFQFEFEAKNADASDIPVTLGCYIKGKEKGEKSAEGEIRPEETITDVTRVKPICSFSAEQTKEFEDEKTATVIGTASFPFETKDVELDVYFTNYENYHNCEEQGYEDYFECYDLPLEKPIRAVYNGEPVEIAIGVGYEEEKQPVVLSYSDSPKGLKFYPMIGLMLSNAWDGKINELTSFEFWVPEGIEIDEDISYSEGKPTYVCPFTFETEEETNKGAYNKYSVSSEFLDDVNFKEAIAVEKHKKFICFLKVDDSFVDKASEGIFFQGSYKASVGYIYQLKDKTEVISILQKGKALTEEGT